MKFGCPTKLISDNATSYENREFRSLLKEFNIAKHEIPPYSPQNNPVERTNRHDSTGFSPAYLNFGHELDIPSKLVDAPNPSDIIPPSYKWNKLRETFDLVKINLAKAFTSQSHYYNLCRREWTPKFGDKVMRKVYNISNAAKQLNVKLAPKFSGPYTIHKVLSKVIFQLKHATGKTVNKVHIEDLKPAHDDNI
ncbi:uncharacterized protein [Diabrotica undecimpunctata]|uniref:uncharacterized protein n=1 Tax=Diabrotica undecimpunctata TaxID=50387 RepID=UPI003B63D9F3